MATEVEEFRAPTPAERAVVEFLTSVGVPGADRLRAQQDGMRVATNCMCGCGSFAIRTPSPFVGDAALPSIALPSSWSAGDAIEMALLTRGGQMVGVEITYFDPGSPPPAGLPSTEGFAFVESAT